MTGVSQGRGEKTWEFPVQSYLHYTQSCAFEGDHWLTRWLSSKEFTCQCRRCRWQGFNPWVGKIHWRKKRPPLQYSCLENSMDREAGWATAHVVSKSRIWLSTAVFCTMWDINLNISISIGFPAGSMVKNPPAKQEIWFNLWVRKIPLRRKWQLTPIFLPRKSHDRGAWWATVHGVTKESDTT